MEKENKKILLLGGLIFIFLLLILFFVIIGRDNDTSPEDSSAFVSTNTEDVEPTEEHDDIFDPPSEGPLPTGRPFPTLPTRFDLDHTSHVLSQDEEFLLSAQITDDCKVRAISSTNEYSFNINYSAVLEPGRSCNSVIRLATPHSYGAAIYQDINVLNSNEVINFISSHHGLFNAQLAEFTTTIKDLQYSSHDKAVVLHTTQDDFEQQFLTIYNTLAIAAEYPDNFVAEENKFDIADISKYSQTIQLPNIGKNYTAVLAGDYYLSVYSEDPTQFESISIAGLDV